MAGVCWGTRAGDDGVTKVPCEAPGVAWGTEGSRGHCGASSNGGGVVCASGVGEVGEGGAGGGEGRGEVDRRRDR